MSIFIGLTSERKTKLLLACAFILLLSIGLFALSTMDQPVGQKNKPAYEYGGDFVLRNHNGKVALQDFRNKVVVAYFGFLNCTEACPESMGTIARAIGKLSPEQREKLQVLFISVDPERDDLEALKEFSDFYAKSYANETNPNLILALTGTQQQIDKVSEDYGVFFDLVDLEGSDLGYTVDHSSRFYMIGGDGKLVKAMNHSTTPTELAAQIKRMQQQTIN